MSDLHELCYFKNRPIEEDLYLKPLKSYLKAGIPATYTLEEAYNYENGIEEEPTSTTTPMHLICENIPLDVKNSEKEVILKMMEELWLNGAGWCLVNGNNDTPACILLRRGLHGSEYWDSCVESGYRAEVVLRKLNSFNVEFLSDDEDEHEDENEHEYEQTETEDNTEKIPELVEETNHQIQDEELSKTEISNDNDTDMYNGPAGATEVYLKTPLEYREGALVTKEGADGVMMEWEDKLMKAGCDSLFSSIEDEENINILNMGFGMGIIDTMIQSRKPQKHYICEAHPDVLKKMKADGWYENPSVVVLEGKWQDTLPDLLTKGIFFDGIYYDTFSETYEDMVEDLFDLIVGLLKPSGTFSFFNGLGADRLVCYEVYKKVVDLDLSNYGLQVKFTEMAAPVTTLEENDHDDNSVWKDIKRPYWRCPIYYHPEVRFI